jgi:hypothetical protein
MYANKHTGNRRPVGPYPSIAAASRATGIHPSTLGGRLKRGWSDFDALTVPVGINPYKNSKKWPVFKTAWLSSQSKAKKLRLSGFTYKSIAKILGCSVSKVSDLLNRQIPAYS